MERTSRKTFYSRIRGLKEVKIGISNNPKIRREQIDEDTPGDVLIRDIYRFPSRFTASAVEKHLHKVFSSNNFRMKAGRRAGVNEWFYLNSREYKTLQKKLDQYYYNGGLNISINLNMSLDDLVDLLLSKTPKWGFYIISILITYFLIKGL